MTSYSNHYLSPLWWECRQGSSCSTTHHWGSAVGLQDPFPRWLPPVAGKLVRAVAGNCRLEPSPSGDLPPPSMATRFQEQEFHDKRNRAVTSLKPQSGNSLSTTSAVWCCSGGPEPTQSQGERTQTLPLSEGSGKEFLARSNLPLWVKRTA